MTYVLDTNCFIVTGHYYPDQFPSFWMKFNQAVDVNKIVSVREVFRELDNAATEPHLVNWIKTHKDIFPAPKSIETEFVQTIFSVKKHFQNLIKEKIRLSGGLCADPFVIAMAKSINGCVVTEEDAEKLNAPNIPNICRHFKIDFTNLQGLMKREKWKF